MQSKITYGTLRFLTFLFVINIFFNISEAQQQKIYKVDQEVVVTGSRIPLSLSDASRNISVISSEQIEAAPVQNLEDLLKYYSSVDIKERGPHGVQADVSIRGGSFEETLFMIDGVKLSDSQTGHNNMNLPVNLNNIDRIEVLRGSASQIYGENAFSGVINIITKKYNKNSLSVQATGGQYSLYGLDLAGNIMTGDVNNRLSYSKTKSDGYHYNTNFDNQTVSYASSVNLDKTIVDFSLGYTDKKFGAYKFYSDKFPNQWEHTKAMMLTGAMTYTDQAFTFSPKIFWRRGDDDYILDLLRPSFYRNNHRTDLYGAEVSSFVTNLLGTTALSGQFSKDEIKSNSLGNHNRIRGGASLEHFVSNLGNFNFSIAGSLNYYDSWGWKLWPGLDAAFKLNKNLKFYFSGSMAYRIPTYTELYYSSPAQKGNAALNPEQALSYEAGFNFYTNLISLKSSVFRREGQNIIDWVRHTKDEPWNALNISKINTNGIESEINLFFGKYFIELNNSSLELKYTYLSSDKKSEGFESLYALDHLRHQLIVSLNMDLPYSIKSTFIFRYENRINFEDHSILDAKISYTLLPVEFFIETTNLFNKAYMDIGGIPMPGRWITTGIKFNLSR